MSGTEELKPGIQGTGGMRRCGGGQAPQSLQNTWTLEGNGDHVGGGVGWGMT